MRSRLPLLVALACVAATYTVGLTNGFVWLDHFEIVEGALVVDSVKGFLALFGNDQNFAGYHRPVYNLIHSVDRALFGLEPFGFQLTSRLLHLANVCLVFVLARRLGREAWLAGLLALLFGLHPVNTAAAGLIHSKADLFVFTASAGCLALFLGRGPGVVGPLGRTLSVLAFVLALFTKETAFCLPLGASLWLVLRARWSPHVDARALRAWVLALWAVALAVGASRFLATDTSYSSELSLVERVLTFLPVYVDYARKLILPLDLAVADTVTRFGALDAAARIQALGAFLFLVVAQVWAWRRVPETRKWIVLYHLALLPVSQIVPILHFRADRFLYVPSLAFVGAILEGLTALATRRPRLLRPLLAAAGLVAVAYAARDVARLRQFESDATLFTAELERRPDYLEGLTHMARHFDRQGRPDLAEELYAACLRPQADIVSYVDGEGTLLAYSATLLANRKPADALALIERFGDAVKSATIRDELSYNRGVAARQLGRHREAYELLSAYGARHPRDASCAYLTAESALALGREAEARAAFERYLSLAPDAPDRALVEERLSTLAPD